MPNNESFNLPQKEFFNRFIVIEKFKDLIHLYDLNLKEGLNNFHISWINPFKVAFVLWIKSKIKQV